MTASQAEAWQATVDRLHRLQQAQAMPDNLRDGVRADTDFDVMAYFDVLDHLAVEPGLVLDYVYLRSPDRGFPVLYGRRVDEARAPTVEAYLRASGRERVAQGDLAYLDHVAVTAGTVDGAPDGATDGTVDGTTDGTTDGWAEGFFQYAVLRVMGGQLYLSWHAQEDDAMVVVTQERLAQLLEPVRNQMGESAVAEAQRADLTPRVDVGDDHVVVEVAVFTRWGGLERWRITAERQYPHRIVDETVERVAPCDCGVPY